MPRLLTTSASACRRLLTKAELMGIDVAALEFQEAQIASLNDVRKKWHIPPAFSVEFIGYYLNRISRSKDVKKHLQEQLDLNKTLVSDQQSLREEYDERMEKIEKMHSAITALCPNKTLTSLSMDKNEVAKQLVETVVIPPQQPVSRPMSVPTAAALKMGVGFPLTIPGTNDDTNRVLSTQCPNKSELLYECGICKRVNDQHLLAKCDTCHLHYHLGCLNPPLTRHPKKSKIYGWQCSECDEDNPEGVVQLTSGPRKSRTKYSKDGTIVPVDSSRDVSMDESGADADDEKINVQSTKSPIKSPIPAKSPKSPTPSPTKKLNKKSDKIDKSPVKSNRTSFDDGMASPVLSTSSLSDANKSDISSKSPSKCKKSLSNSSTNLDKVIEAVSKGILEGNYDPVNDVKYNHMEIKLMKSPRVVLNGIQTNDTKYKFNNTKSASPVKSPSPKSKNAKKSNMDKEIEKEQIEEKVVGKDKEKEKERDKSKVKEKKKETEEEKGKEMEREKKKEKVKEKEKDKEKCKVKEKSKDKSKEKEEEKEKERVKEKEKSKDKDVGKDKVREKSKRKLKLKSDEETDTDAKTTSSQPKVKMAKRDSATKSNENKVPTNSVNKTQIEIKDIEMAKVDSSVDSTNRAESKNSNEIHSTPAEITFNGDSFNAHSTSNGITEVVPTTTTPTIQTAEINTTTTTSSTNETDIERKLNRKRRKEKHRNKHGLDSERSSSKEHKKKRKRKSHDRENLEPFPLADGVPKIKIKFKPLPLPGETVAESHFFYVPANMVRPRESRKTRPASVNSIDDVTSTPFTSKSPPSTISSPLTTPQKDSNRSNKAATPPSAHRTRRTSVLQSPPKANSRRTSTPVSSNSNETNEIQVCFVCQVSGSAQELVKCDECKRSYHFQCLDPPLKKTPKKRGYSWHCAECDPTDKEDN